MRPFFMTVKYLAVKTLAAIEAAISADQGAAYRTHLKAVLPTLDDAYRGADEGFRSHLGASMIGRKCARELWYSFHWARKPRFEGRMLRLFNRGHLEEGRMIAALLTIGCTIYQQDENGKQYRISEFGGHFGGSGDGVVVGCPDIPNGAPAVTEFKTHNSKSFEKLKKEGVETAKPEHFIQTQIYMNKMQIDYGLYLAVNKDTDELYGEALVVDRAIDAQFTERAQKIVFMRTPPPKIHNSPAWFECKFCDARTVCHLNYAVERNCRTCAKIQAQPDGTWACTVPTPAYTLSKAEQLQGCGHWEQFKEK